MQGSGACCWQHTLIINIPYWGEHERAPHKRTQQVKICMYVCTYVQFAQIKLVQLTTLYDYELHAVCKDHHVRSSRYCVH